MKLLVSFYKKIKLLLLDRQPRYRIAEIDTESEQAIFRVRNKNVFFQCALPIAIINRDIMNGLSPSEASWLGGHFGRSLRLKLEKAAAFKKVKNIPFLLIEGGGQYQITFLNRDGRVGYIDRKSKKEFLEHPLTLVNNRHIISKFDTNQACYIGILAGVSMEKAISFDLKTGQATLNGLMNKYPMLRMIK
jgi:hypothetical protein